MIFPDETTVFIDVVIIDAMLAFLGDGTDDAACGERRTTGWGDVRASDGQCAEVGESVSDGGHVGVSLRVSNYASPSVAITIRSSKVRTVMKAVA